MDGSDYALAFARLFLSSAGEMRPMLFDTTCPLRMIEQGGNAHDLETGGQVRLPRRYLPCKMDLGVLISRPLHRGGQHLAGAAPGREEINYNKIITGVYRLIEIILCQMCKCHNVYPPELY